MPDHPRLPAASPVRFAPTPGGARIAWARTGRGPVMVRAAHWMTHVGHDAESPIWAPWIARLSEQVRLVRYDARGCGLSDADAAPCGLEASVEELAAVVAAQDAPSVHVLGISSGAAAAIAFAAREPQRVASLVLVGASACGLLHHPLSAQQKQLFEATLEMVALGWGRRSPAVQQFFTTTMLPEADAEQARALNEQQRQSCDGARAAAIMRANASLDVRPLLGELRCRTLVLHAARDAMVPVALGRDLAARIAGAQFQTLPTANHVPLAGEPAFDLFCEALAAFVQPAGGSTLTPRQRELLELVAAGLDNAQIGARLRLADKSVRNALSRLYATLEVENRPQAIVKARTLGFGALPPP
jgi:pimeloyl-ACP methyl ester carboxylesterase/DNA-binding CsgD family transcriptional regulator